MLTAVSKVKNKIKINCNTNGGAQNYQFCFCNPVMEETKTDAKAAGKRGLFIFYILIHKYKTGRLPGFCTD